MEADWLARFRILAVGWTVVAIIHDFTTALDADDIPRHPAAFPSGKGLLKDAMRWTVQAADIVGIRALSTGSIRLLI